MDSLLRQEIQEAVKAKLGPAVAKKLLSGAEGRTRKLLKAAARAAPELSLLPAPILKISLAALCTAGAASLGVDLSDPIYKARLEKELSLIATKDYADYFLIVADIVRWAKERMIVGPARGSSCGSLVCYLAGITSVDPIPHSLIFERFIDVNRGGWRYDLDPELFGEEFQEYGPFPPSLQADLTL